MAIGWDPYSSFWVLIHHVPLFLPCCSGCLTAVSTDVGVGWGQVRDEPWTFTSKSLILSFSNEGLMLDYTMAAYVVISSPLISITTGECLILLAAILTPFRTF